MKYYKSVYLLKTVDSGKSKLVAVSDKEWYETVRANHADPNAQQRYFICDTIIDGECKDRIFMEVTEAEYKQWKIKQQSTRRWLDSKKEVSLLSLDSPTEEENITLEDTLKTDCRLDDFYITKVLLSELRREVVKWKPWAGELLKTYLKGQQRASTAWLAEQCNVSVQMARRYEEMELCLCPACVKQFINTDLFIVKKSEDAQGDKAICCYCNAHDGFDYRIINKKRRYVSSV